MAGTGATVRTSKKILQQISMTKSQDKIAIITGGSRGLGRSTVLSLAKRGVDSIFTYRSNQSEAENVTELVADNKLSHDRRNVPGFDRRNQAQHTIALLTDDDARFANS
jgi:NAD(P)-dependent dehydrogenase (short-subunit alcohol dehydrogenase family)